MDVGLLNSLGGFIDRAGTVGVLLVALFVILVGAHRGWWVPGAQFKKTEKSCTRWERLALELLNTAGESVSLAEFFRSGGGET
jgi:hypothetical protein